MRFSVGQCSKEPLERFMKALGNIGSIKGPYKHKNPNANLSYQWLCYSASDNFQAMSLLLPRVCSIKKQQIEEAWAKFSISLTRGDLAIHCRKGHPWIEENIQYIKGFRRCRECLRIRARKRRAKRKQALIALGYWSK